jgi:RNA polymerase sigma-70 factor (ECF subfamily)
MDKTDVQLVQEIILDTQGSFEELVTRYTKPLYNFTFRLTHDPQTAEDLAQETFLKVWKSLEKYDQNQNFRGWIFTIARNTTTDYLRKKKSIPFSVLSKDDDYLFEDHVSDTAPLPDETISALEDTESLEKILATLPIDYQIVLLLHYQEGLTFEEIGDVVDKPPNTVKSWHRRALIALRENPLITHQKPL